jgi:hypothetical protein
MQQRVSSEARQRTTERLIGEAGNWTGFWDRLVASNDAAQQGAAFERLTQLLLQTQPEYQLKLKHVWLLSEVPQEVRAKLRLPQLDEGIDLVAETHEGTFWAIQSKFRSERNGTLTRKDLDTFTSLTFVACTGISLAVVAHTLSKPIRKRHLMGNTVHSFDKALRTGPASISPEATVLIGSAFVVTRASARSRTTASSRRRTTSASPRPPIKTRSHAS